MNYEFPPVGGGGGRVAEDLCRGLAARGHQVRVLTSHVPGLRRHEVRDGFEIVRSPAGRSRLDRCSPPEMLSYVGLGAGRALYDALFWKPDVVHVHFAVPSGPLAWMAHRLTGVPYVLTAHLGDVPGGVPEQTEHLFRLVKPFTRPIWASASHRTAVSEFTRRLAESAYGLPVETIFNGVNLQTCRPGPFVPAGKPQLLFAGRFSVQKNVLFLIDLLARVRDLDWTLEMLGDGPLRAAVAARVAEYGLSQRILLRGWVPPEQVERVMQRSDILLLPSLSEGLSVVGVRALAFGLAALASDVPGNLDLVHPGKNGYLCPVNDLATFEHQLRQMLHNTNLLTSMKRASRELAQAFDLQRIIGRYEAVFESICRRRVAA